MLSALKNRPSFASGRYAKTCLVVINPQPHIALTGLDSACGALDPAGEQLIGQHRGCETRLPVG